jgi:hypothetical protein
MLYHQYSNWNSNRKAYQEARSRLEMPEGSSTHQGHKHPMSHEHILSTIYHHRIGRYSRSVTQAKICPRFSMCMTDKPDDTADTIITPSFAILASTTGTLYLSKLPAVLARMAWIGVSKLKFQWTKTSKAPTQDTLMLYLPILWYHNHCYGKRQKLIQQTPLQAINDNSLQDEEISKKQLKHKIKNL